MSVSADFQHTLTSPVGCHGIGLHSAGMVEMTIHPAPVDTGIVFRRTDISDMDTTIAAHYGNIADTMLNSRIMNDEGATVGTVEHLMAAFYGLGIDNAIVDVNAPELPAMDGSAAPYCIMLRKAGMVAQNTPRRILRVLNPITVEGAQGRMTIEPPRGDTGGGGLSVEITIAFDDPAIGSSGYSYIHREGSFENEVAAARTFCMYRDVAKLRAAGYSLGGSLANAVVVDDGKVMNEGGLRFADEFVRHKLLDCLGDLYLGGFFIHGHVTASMPGHALNNLLLKTLLADASAYTIMDAEAAHAENTEAVPMRMENTRMENKGDHAIIAPIPGNALA